MCTIPPSFRLILDYMISPISSSYAVIIHPSVHPPTTFCSILSRSLKWNHFTVTHRELCSHTHIQTRRCRTRWSTVSVMYEADWNSEEQHSPKSSRKAFPFRPPYHTSVELMTPDCFCSQSKGWRFHQREILSEFLSYWAHRGQNRSDLGWIQVGSGSDPAHLEKKAQQEIGIRGGTTAVQQDGFNPGTLCASPAFTHAAFAPAHVHARTRGTSWHKVNVSAAGIDECKSWLRTQRKSKLHFPDGDTNTPASSLNLRFVT